MTEFIAVSHLSDPPPDYIPRVLESVVHLDRVSLVRNAHSPLA